MNKRVVTLKWSGGSSGPNQFVSCHGTPVFRSLSFRRLSSDLLQPFALSLPQFSLMKEGEDSLFEKSLRLNRPQSEATGSRVEAKIEYERWENAQRACRRGSSSCCDLSESCLNVWKRRKGRRRKQFFPVDVKIKSPQNPIYKFRAGLSRYISKFWGLYWLKKTTEIYEKMTEE